MRELLARLAASELRCAPASWWWVLASLLLGLGVASATRRIRSEGLISAAALLRAGTVALVLVALARPVLVRPAEPRPLVALVDGSVSMTGVAPTPPNLVDRAAGAKVFYFARDVSPISPTTWAPQDVLGTNLERALRVAMSSVDGEPVDILLWSDGRETTGRALLAAEDARRAGTRIFALEQGEARGHPDVGLVGLDVRGPTVPRAPLVLEASIAATEPATRTIELRRDGVAVSRRNVSLAPGLSGHTLDARLDGEGVAAFEVALLEPDERPENDVASVLVEPTPAPRVTVVTPALRTASALVSALERAGFAVSHVAPSALGRALDAGEDGPDLLVVIDTPAEALDPSAPALERRVRGGTGLLVVGGPHAFEAGGYERSAFGALLPLASEPTATVTEPTAALALVIDRSGSMAGPKLELTKEAARATVAALAPDDLVSIVAFDSQPYPVARLQRAANRPRLLGDLSRLAAGGGTNLVPALRLAVTELAAANARRKHVIVLSDGQSQREGLDEILEDSRASRITISTIGVGEGADQALLAIIANRGGGRSYQTTDPSTIPRLFSRAASELRGSDTGERPSRIRVAKRADLLAGLSFGEAPALDGHNTTRARPGAEVLLTSGDGAPLLARRPLGAGEVIAWASDAGGRWTQSFVRWPASGRLWAQLARSLTRLSAGGEGAGSGAEALHVDRRGDDVDVSFASAVEPSRLEFLLDGGARGQVGVPARSLAPHLLGARLPLAPRPALVRLRASSGAPDSFRRAGSRIAHLAPAELWPATPEAIAEGRARLANLTSITAGRVLRLDEPLPLGTPRRHRNEVPLAPWLSAVATLIFVADVAARRATFRVSRTSRPGRGAVW